MPINRIINALFPWEVQSGQELNAAIEYVAVDPGAIRIHAQIPEEFDVTHPEIPAPTPGGVVHVKVTVTRRQGARETCDLVLRLHGSERQTAVKVNP